MSLAGRSNHYFVKLIIAETIKTCEISDGISRDVFVTTSTTKSTTRERGRGRRGNLLWLASTFSSSLSFRAERPRINLSGRDGGARSYAHACITHGPGRESHHAHESLYVAQGCSSSGSLLCVAFVASPPPARIYIPDHPLGLFTRIIIISSGTYAKFQWTRHTIQSIISVALSSLQGNR